MMLRVLAVFTLAALLPAVANEESVATLSIAGDTCDALKEGSIATLDVESVAAVPLVQFPFADYRPKQPASASTAPVVEGPSFAELDFSFDDMDYDAVISSAETTIGLVEAIRKSMAEQAGIQPEQIRVILSPGSVKVKISIACADLGSAAVVSQRAIKSDGDALLRIINKNVAKVPGVQAARTAGGDLVIGSLRVKVGPAGRPTSAKVREEVALEAVKQAFQLPGEEHEAEVFNALDANKDGVISKAEMASFKKGKVLLDGTTAHLLTKIVEKDVHTPSDCSIAGGASDAGIAKTVEELVAKVGAKAKEGVEEEERTPSAHESALEEQQNALAVKDIVHNMANQVDEKVSQATNTLASEGETKVAPAMVVHPEAERPEASMIGTMASDRGPTVHAPEDAGSATDAMTAVVESTTLAKDSAEVVAQKIKEEERKKEEEARLEERKRKVGAAIAAIAAVAIAARCF